MANIGRREFFSRVGAGAAASAALVSGVRVAEAANVTHIKPAARPVSAVGDRVDPWIEVDPAALRYNAATISAKVGGKPVLSVLKCNAYGMDPAVVAPILETAPQVWGFAVVKAEEAFAVRETGAKKPIVTLADFATSDAAELARQNVALCTYSMESKARFVELAKKLGHPVKIHVKIDAGLGRLGIPYYMAEQWVADLVATAAVKIEGIFCNLVELELAAQHLQNFKTVVGNLRAKGFNVGKAHAAASFAITHVKDSAMDMVRPGIMTYGVYADDTPPGFIELHTVHRLRGRVVRVSPIRTGDGVGYSQAFVAKEPGWTATVMCGWSDGYDYKANKGCEVLIGGKLYPLIGRTANNAVVDLGKTPAVREGDIATLVGPEPGVQPNELGLKSTGTGDGYNQIRYSAKLPKFIVS